MAAESGGVPEVRRLGRVGVVVALLGRAHAAERRRVVADGRAVDAQVRRNDAGAQDPVLEPAAAADERELLLGVLGLGHQVLSEHAVVVQGQQ